MAGLSPIWLGVSRLLSRLIVYNVSCGSVEIKSKRLAEQFLRRPAAVRIAASASSI